jgi:hypothetical protein
VSTCFDLIAMNTKIFGELGAAVGVWMLSYSKRKKLGREKLGET